MRSIGLVFSSLRAPRVLMLGIVTGSTAFGLGAPLLRSGLATLFGSLLSLSGFVLDDYVDRHRDGVGMQRRSSIAAGAIGPRGAITVSVLCFAGAAVTGVLTQPWMLVPACGVVAVVLLPAFGVGDGPVSRAISLGVLQALYAVSGGITAGSKGPALPLIALFLFFAMTGGKVLGEVRDLGTDLSAGTETLPIRYGMRSAGVFLVANELVAYAFGLAAGVAGRLGPAYLFCMGAIAIVGTGTNIWFLLAPTPKRADIANRLSLGALGGLYCLGMVLAGLRA